MCEIYDKLQENIANYQREGFGWIQNGELRCEFNLSKYTPIRGSSYVDLPGPIKNKQCCINVQNNDNKCFEWAVLSALHPVDEKYYLIELLNKENIKMN